jgi:hypothetical protein
MRTATTTLALASFLALATVRCSSGESADGGPTDARHDTGAMTDTGAADDVQDTSTATDAAEAGADVAQDTSSDTGGAGTPGDHLVISEIETDPANAEFVEIYNPTASAVDLGNYYLSDNSTYTSIAAGMPWMPITANPGTDFLAQFPSGAMIPPGGVIVVATSPMFTTAFSRCPDFILASSDLTCPGGGTARAMVAPTNGDLGSVPGSMFSNAREMLVLFRWSGSTTEGLKDVDYVTWGAMFEDGTRVDKTGVGSYLPDTPVAMQHPAPAPAAGMGVMQSIERCTLDAGERLTGGNGITGHDETSEQLDVSFRVQAAPTPGTRNACLM